MLVWNGWIQRCRALASLRKRCTVSESTSSFSAFFARSSHCGAGWHRSSGLWACGFRSFDTYPGSAFFIGVDTLPDIFEPTIFLPGI
jgi:hypothetical protein